MSVRSALALLAVLTTAAACSDPPPRLRVTQIEVTMEFEPSLLDVEVHLFDEATRAHLGCAGRDEGLEEVDENDVRYRVDAELRDTRGAGELGRADLVGRSIEVVVIEDDAEPCPVPPGIDDDVIGIAPNLTLETFEAATLLSFDDVVALELSLD